MKHIKLTIAIILALLLCSCADIADRPIETVIIERIVTAEPEIVEVFTPYEVPVEVEVLIPVEITVPVVETVLVPVEQVYEKIVPVEVTRVVEKVVTVPVEVEKIVEVPVEKIVEVTVPVERTEETTDGFPEPYGEFHATNVNGSIIYYAHHTLNCSYREVTYNGRPGDIYLNNFDVTVYQLYGVDQYRGLTAVLCIRQMPGGTPIPDPEGVMYMRYYLYDYTANVDVCEGLIEMCLLNEGEALISINVLFDGQLNERHAYELSFGEYYSVEDIVNGN